MPRGTLGERELDVLAYVSERAPLSAREVAEQFGEPRGLAKSTVVTLMERLRKKGYLTRRKKEGVYHYSPRVPHSEVLQELVKDFLERTLGGSVSPVFAYLTRARQLSDQQLAELEAWVEQQRADREEKKP